VRASGSRCAKTADVSKDPLHGVTLERIVTELHARYGWEALAAEVPIRCFSHDPSVKSSLTFLRRTPWARKKVEQLYLQLLAEALPVTLTMPPKSTPS
jgi:uncharacterized protein (DUF2132 family)